VTGFETTIAWRSIPELRPLRQEQRLAAATAFGNELLGPDGSLVSISSSSRVVVIWVASLWITHIAQQILHTHILWVHSYIENDLIGRHPSGIEE